MPQKCCQCAYKTFNNVVTTGSGLVCAGCAAYEIKKNYFTKPVSEPKSTNTNVVSETHVKKSDWILSKKTKTKTYIKQTDGTTETITDTTEKIYERSKLPSVFDSFFDHGIIFNFNSMAITLLVITIVISVLVLGKNEIKKELVKVQVENFTNIGNLYTFFYNGTVELCGRKGSRIFGLFITIFIYLVTLNITGLLIFGVTIKSQLSTTFWFSITIVLSCIILGIRNKGKNFFLIFWNTSVDMLMRIILLFVEVLSFSIRPISYALRLFANLLSGHILLHLFAKVINILRKRNKFIAATIPFTFLATFGTLETLIAGLQSFIPSTLAQIWGFEIF